jgi:hypothetical protein
MVHIQYKKATDHPLANFLHLHLSKDKAITETISLINSLQASTAMVIYTDGSYDQNKSRASAAVNLESNQVTTMALGINPYLSNHECEATGVLLALKLIQATLTQHR